MGRVLIVAAVCASIGAAPADDNDPLAILSRMLADSEKTEPVLVSLRATGDKDLKLLLEALSRSKDPQKRRFAVAAMVEIFDREAVDLLKQRLTADPSKAIRVSAMARLVALDALKTDEIGKLLSSSDEEIRCLAADAMVRREQGRSVLKHLRQMANSQDLPTACTVRLGLVSLGETDHLEWLGKLVESEQTETDLILQMLSQIAEERITGAVDLAKRVANSDRSDEVRIQAYWAICDALPDAGEIIYRAIRRSDSMVFAVNLLRVLSQTRDAETYVKQLAKQNDPVGRVARFELVRSDGGTAGIWAVRDVLVRPHPVVVEYVLDRARQDVDARGKDAGFYAQALLGYVNSHRSGSSQMTAEHYQIAKAATILADLGTPEAVGGLKKLLSGSYGPTVRAVAAGLLRAKNPIACDLARPLLKSPYPELVCDGALVLGRFGDPSGREKLAEFAAGSGAQPLPVKVMSCWYLLKIEGRTRLGAGRLGKQILEAGDTP